MTPGNLQRLQCGQGARRVRVRNAKNFLPVAVAVGVLLATGGAGDGLRGSSTACAQAPGTPAAREDANRAQRNDPHALCDRASGALVD